jgi:hypothetical protein
VDRDCVGIIIYEMGVRTKAKARRAQFHKDTAKGEVRKRFFGRAPAEAPTLR